MLLDILLSLGPFNKAINKKDKNCNLPAKRNISLILLLSIMLKILSNLLFGLSRNYGKLKKKKSKARLMSWNIEDLGYIMD